MSLFGKKRIFLDYASGSDNPSGIHQEGLSAKRKLSEARLKVAQVLGVQERDIVFTSGGTEADNLAILGVFEQALKDFERPHIVIGEHEHPAVLLSAKEVERRGGEVTITSDPISHIKENTVLISMMYANNETGAINPIVKIARHLKEVRKKSGRPYPYFHTDASQAALYLPIMVSKLGVDLMTLDASKVYGPKGCGLLVVRPPVAVTPQSFGGGQERGLRSGTENVLAITSFAEALQRGVINMDKESERLNQLKKFFIESITTQIPEAIINTPENSLPNIVSLSFPGKLHEFLAISLDEKGIAVSTGSSCLANKDEGDREALRFSFGKDTTQSDLKKVVRTLKQVVL